MSIAAESKNIFNEDNPSMADIKVFGHSLHEQLRKLGFRNVYGGADHVSIYEDPDGFIMYVGSGEEHLKVSNSTKHGATGVYIEPWRTVEINTDYGSVRSSSVPSNIGGSPQLFSWKNKEKAEAFIGTWVMNCASPAAAKALKREMRL